MISERAETNRIWKHLTAFLRFFWRKSKSGATELPYKSKMSLTRNILHLNCKIALWGIYASTEAFVKLELIFLPFRPLVLLKLRQNLFLFEIGFVSGIMKQFLYKSFLFQIQFPVVCKKLSFLIRQFDFFFSISGTKDKVKHNYFSIFSNICFMSQKASL